MRLLLALAIVATANGQSPSRKPVRVKPAVQRPAQVTSWTQLQFPPLKPAKLPAVETYTLPNGLRVYLLEDHELPMVKGIALVRTSSLFDPPGKVGLAAMTGMVMRSGGTKSLTGDRIDEQFEAIDASVDSTIEESNANVRFASLTSASEPVMQIFRDIVIAPEFRDGSIAAARNQLRASIANRNDKPDTLASREFTSLLYGRDTPYGWTQQPQHLQRIRRADLVSFHQRYFFPANVQLAIYGHFQTAEMKARIEKLFGGWNATQAAVPPFTPVAVKPAPGVFLADIPRTPRTVFQIGHLGGKLSDKDYAALKVAVAVLGGSSTSRLSLKLRHQLGWVSEISAEWEAGFDHPGAFRVTGSAKSTSAADTFETVEQEIRRLATTDPTDQELRLARDHVQNAVVMSLDTTEKGVLRVLNFDYYGYPKDFLAQHQAAIAAVTKADLRRVAGQYLKPDQLTFLAVADSRDFLRPLSILNRNVEKLDMTIPQLTADEVKPTPETIAEGRKLLERMRQAIGGAEKLAAIKDWSEEADFQFAPAAGGILVKEVDTWVAPTHFRQSVTLPFARMHTYCDGEKGWIVTPRGDGPLLGDQLKQAQNEIFRSYVWLFMSDRDPGKTIHMPEENAVEVLGKDGQVVRILFDPTTGMPAGTIQDTPQGNLQEHWSDFQLEAGIQFPRKITILRNGGPFAAVTVSSIKVNQGETVQSLSRRPTR